MCIDARLDNLRVVQPCIVKVRKEENMNLEKNVNSQPVTDVPQPTPQPAPQPVEAPQPTPQPSEVPQPTLQPAPQPALQPAEVPQPAPQPILQQEETPQPSKKKKKKEKPEDTEESRKVVGVGAFLGISLLFGIPVIGFFACAVMSFAPKNKNVKNYSRAMLIWMIIGLIISAGLIALGIWLANEILSYIKEITEGPFAEVGKMFSQFEDIGELLNQFKDMGNMMEGLEDMGNIMNELPTDGMENIGDILNELPTDGMENIEDIMNELQTNTGN